MVWYLVLERTGLARQISDACAAIRKHLRVRMRRRSRSQAPKQPSVCTETIGREVDRATCGAVGRVGKTEDV
jgi:hypothetical protein